jgi:hypothetical protein
MPKKVRTNLELLTSEVCFIYRSLRYRACLQRA